MRIKSFLLFRHLRKKEIQIRPIMILLQHKVHKAHHFSFNVNSTVFVVLFICNLINRLGEISPRYEQIRLKVLLLKTV